MAIPVSENVTSYPRLVTTPTELAECAAWLAEQQWIGLDCEAAGKNPMTAIPLLFQAGDGECVWVVVLPRFSELQLRPLWAAIKKSRALVVGHNLNYDYRLLRSHYGKSVAFPRVYDTMLAELLLTSGEYGKKGLWLQAVSLKACVEQHLGIALDKEVRETFYDITAEEAEEWLPTAEQVRYSADDVAVLELLYEAQVKLLRSERLLKAAKLRFNALVPLAEVEMRGMRIDTDTWRRYLEEVETERLAVEAKLQAQLTVYEMRFREQEYFEAVTARNHWLEEYELFQTEVKAAWEGSDKSVPWGKYKNERLGQFRELHPRPAVPHLDDSPINLNSPQQVARAFDALGLQMDSTDKLARAKALRNPKLEADQRAVLETYARYTQLNQIKKGFGESVLAMITPEGRLHTQINIGMTDTGRMSSEHPNFQNMPKVDAIRHAFIADPGTVVITADYTGQELCIVAAMSGCKRMKDDLMQGKDLYKELAAMVWGGKPADVPKDQRQKAKSALLGINYGLSEVGLEKNHGIDRATARKLLDAIKKRYPEVVAWGDEQAKLAISRKWVETATGARRYFRNPSLPTWQYDTQGRNAPVQGTGAEVVYRLADRLEANAVPKGVLPVNYVHDEVVALAPANRAEESKELLIAEMKAAFNDILPFERYGMRVSVDAHIAEFWTKD